MRVKHIAEYLLNWFDTHGRKTLPWQIDKTPYRVWLSEIMLQQTQVATVIPYFVRFTQHFPTLADLANADIHTVLHLWAGLGYYSRARNLHRCAQIVMQDHHGQLPAAADALIQLPGIGRSTANAILAIAWQQRATILDGNVKRVLARLYAITDWPGEKIIEQQLWHLAEKMTPHQRVDAYTQAIMDLGATLCTRGTPACPRCPLQRQCSAYKAGIVKTVPRPRPKKILPIKTTRLLIIQHAQHVLLLLRPSHGIWGGLWSLPEIASAAKPVVIRQYCQQQWACQITALRVGDAFRHTFTHFHLEIEPIFMTCRQRPAVTKAQMWYNLHTPQAVGLPAPIKKILAMLK